MKNSQVINEIKRSKLIATCSHCGEDFDLSKATLFDGLGEFPEVAELRTRAMLEELQDRIEDLKKRKVSAAGAEQKAISVGVGKIIEKVLPAYKDFRLPLPDCRPLFEPIDLVVFNGASKQSVDSITFLEIKTGESRLNKHQKMIQHAVEDQKVRYEEV